MTIAQVLTSFLAFGILAFLSYIAFRWGNPVLWFIIFIDAYITGLYTPNLLSGVAESTPLGITIGLLLIAYALFAAGMSFVEMFTYEE